MAGSRRAGGVFRVDGFSLGRSAGTMQLTVRPVVVAKPIQSTPFQRKSLPRSARELVLFLGAVGVVTDVVILAMLLGEASGGRSPIVEIWQLVKGLILVVMLLGLAIRIRLLGFGFAAVLLALFFLEVTGVGGYMLGVTLAELTDLSGLEELIPAPSSSWGMLFILGGLTLLIGPIFALSGNAHSPLMSTAGRVLAVHMLLIFVFAGIWRLFGDAFPQLALGDLAVVGTLLGLSLAIAYCGGLLRVAGQWLDV